MLNRQERILVRATGSLVVMAVVVTYYAQDFVTWFKDEAEKQTAGAPILYPFDLTLNWTAILAGMVASFSTGYLLNLGFERLIFGTDVERSIRRPLITLTASVVVVALAYFISSSLFEGV